MLIALFGYREHLAAGTSLAAIILIAVFAAVMHGGIYGNVDLETGLILAGPAVAGVVIGATAQQRLPERTISIIFAILLIVIGVEMMIG